MKRISVLLLALLMALACASALAETAADQGYTVKTGVSYDDPWGITVANVIYKSDGSVQYRHIPAAHVASRVSLSRPL